jgi:hypothetical protein
MNIYFIEFDCNLIFVFGLLELSAHGFATRKVTIDIYLEFPFVIFHME